MKKHGEIEPDGHGRWCAVCRRAHGLLYPCLYYGKKIKAEIRRETAELRRKLNDGVWCEEEIEKGLPPEGIIIFRAFAGLD